MSLFLSDAEREQILAQPSHSPTATLLYAMQARVRRRAYSPGFSERGATTEWWHHAAEILTDAALVHAVVPTPDVAAWLRSAILAIVRRPVNDWAGPPFRGYSGGEVVGGLETGHLTWSLAIAFDLVGDLFPPEETEEIASILRLRGLEPCRRFVAKTDFFHNWNCVLLAGFAVAAAVLGDEEAVAEAAAFFPLAADHFQPDGSYGESLQYANYAAYSIILAREALIRFAPATEPTLEPYARMVNWAAQSYFYRKPLSGWGPAARPRSANFGDSAAIFAPSGDLLMHIAAHGREKLPTEAGLARWLFDTAYFPANDAGPHDLASFGFVNGFGFLSVILLPRAAAALSPEVAGLPLTTDFSAGDAFARDSWGGLTTLAARSASEPRHASAHLHGDVNSFILVHRGERLLVDPGHSCYRNITHALEAVSLTHNTCTFETASSVLTQRGGVNRPILHEAGRQRAGEPVDIGGKRLIAARVGPVSVIGSEAAPLYGLPLRSFTRFWILCGAHALFIVDRIEADEPVRATWHWLLNNRDGLLDLQLFRPHRIVARRGDAGLSLTHFGGGQLNGPTHAHVHDAYHPLPAQLGEGRPGSGQIMRWSESAPAAERIVVHGICLDSHAGISGWEARREGEVFVLEGADRQEKWTLDLTPDFKTFEIAETFAGRRFFVRNSGEGRTLHAR